MNEWFFHDANGNVRMRVHKFIFFFLDSCVFLSFNCTIKWTIVNTITTEKKGRNAIEIKLTKKHQKSRRKRKRKPKANKIIFCFFFFFLFRCIQVFLCFLSFLCWCVGRWGLMKM